MRDFPCLFRDVIHSRVATRPWSAPIALVLLCAFTAPIFTAPAGAAEVPAGPIEPEAGGLIDVPMDRDPPLELPARRVVFHPRLKGLWLEALDQPDADLRRRAALAFGEAHREGMTGLDDVAERLVTLVRTDPEPMVRLAAARTLIELDHRAAAPALLEQTGNLHDHEMVLLVDDALARWDHAPARERWMTRLTDDAAPITARLSAMQALATVGHTAAATPMMDRYVMARQAPLPLRLAAAEAVGRLHAGGTVASAARLAGGDAMERLMAVRLLAETTAADAAPVLRRLAADDTSVVAAAAMQSLNAHHPDVAASLAPERLDHADPAVRLEAVRALAAVPSRPAVRQLAARLDDASPAVRHTARSALRTMHDDDALRSAVRTAVMSALGGSSWRAQEQAALLAGQVGHEAAADRLVALLPSDRAEVRLASAAALRELAVPSTAPAMVAYVQRAVQRMAAASEQEAPFETLRQLEQEAAQLVMALGQMRYASADAMLRKLVPKGSPAAETVRSAAVWSLGLIHEGEPDDTLVRALMGRLNDRDMMNPESPRVQLQAAVALGRMGATQAVGTLRHVPESEIATAEIIAACRWAIEQITGEPQPPLPVQERSAGGWFLEPVD